MHSTITKYTKIPYKCLQPLVKDPSLLKAFCIYGKLKLCFTYSTIHNISSRKKEIANYLGISENTFRKYLGILKSKGLVEQYGNNIVFCSKTKLYTIFNIERNFNENQNKYSEKFFSLGKADLTIDNIRLLALRQKRDQINYNNKHRVARIILKSFGTIKCPATKQKLFKQSLKKAEKIVSSHNQNIAKRLVNSKYGFIDDNMCTQSISSMIGRKSKMTGFRFMKRLSQEGRISYEERTLKIKDLDRYENIDLMREVSPFFISIKKNTNSSYSLVYKMNSCWTFIK